MIVSVNMEPPKELLVYVIPMYIWLDIFHLRTFTYGLDIFGSITMTIILFFWKDKPGACATWLIIAPRLMMINLLHYCYCDPQETVYDTGEGDLYSSASITVGKLLQPSMIASVIDTFVLGIYSRSYGWMLPVVFYRLVDICSPKEEWLCSQGTLICIVPRVVAVGCACLMNIKLGIMLAVADICLYFLIYDWYQFYDGKKSVNDRTILMINNYRVFIRWPIFMILCYVGIVLSAIQGHHKGMWIAATCSCVHMLSAAILPSKLVSNISHVTVCVPPLLTIFCIVSIVDQPCLDLIWVIDNCDWHFVLVVAIFLGTLITIISYNRQESQLSQPMRW